MTYANRDDSEPRVLWDSISDSVIVLAAIALGFVLGSVIVAWLGHPVQDFIPHS